MTLVTQQEIVRTRLIARGVTLSRHWIVLIVGLTLLCLTAIAATILQWAGRQTALEQFGQRAAEAKHLVIQRFSTYEQLLHSTAAHVAATKNISRNEFRRFRVHAVSEEKYPGVLTLGYAPIVHKTKRARLEQLYRERTQKDFRLWPDSTYSFGVAIAFIEPFTGDNIAALGYDMYSQVDRRLALDHALYTNSTVMTEPIRLVFDEENAGRTGVVVYHPVRSDVNSTGQPRDNVSGFVFSAFRLNQLLDGTLLPLKDDLSLAISSQNPGSTSIYQSKLPVGLERHASRYTWEAHARILGRDVALQFRSLPAFEQRVASNTALIVILSGLVLTAIVSGALAMLLRQQAIHRVSQQAAQRKMAEQEVLFSTLAHQAPIGILMTDSQGQCSFVNDHWCLLSGLSKEAAHQRGWQRAVHPEDHDRVMHIWKNALESGKPASIDHRYLRPNGEVIWTTSSASALVDERGNVKNYLVIAVDQNERLKMERALRASEERFRNLTELSSDWYWEQDENYRFTLQSSEAYGAIGIELENIIGKTRWDLDFIGMSERDWSDHRAILDARQRFFNLELERVLPDGRHRLVSVSGEPVFDEAGNFTGYRGTGTDITQRKLAERELAANRQFLNAVVEAIPIPIAVKDAVGRFALVNRANARINMRSVSEMLGKTDADLFEKTRATQYMSEDREVLRTGVPLVVEQSFESPGGDSYWIIKHKQRIALGDGTAGVISVLVDISARRRAEDALRASEERFRSLTAMSADWYWEQDRELRFTYFSDMAMGKMPVLANNMLARPVSNSGINLTLTKSAHLT